MRKRIENAYTQAGRIANSPERRSEMTPAAGGRREESRLYSVDGQQIRLDG